MHDAQQSKKDTIRFAEINKSVNVVLGGLRGILEGGIFDAGEI